MCSGSQLTMTELPTSSGVDQLVRESACNHAARSGGHVELRVHPEVDDLGDRSSEQ